MFAVFCAHPTDLATICFFPKGAGPMCKQLDFVVKNHGKLVVCEGRAGPCNKLKILNENNNRYVFTKVV